MANIKLRSTTSATDPGLTSAKGSALTHSEMDSNFILLNNEKLDAANGTATGTLTLANNGILQLNEASSNGSNYVQVKTPAALSGNYVLTLPPNDGGSGEVLTTDGSGVLTWTAKTALTGLDIDGFTDGTGITLAATDKLLVSDDDDSDAEKKINASQIDTYVSGTTSTLTNKTLSAPVLTGSVTTTSNGNITLAPNGTGQIRIDSNVIEQHSGAGIVINHLGQGTHNGAKFGAPEGNNDGSTMLFNTGIQIEGRGQYEYPAIVLRNNSISGYNNIWAAKARPSGGSTFTTDDYLDDGDIIFKFFGGAFQGTDSEGNSLFGFGSATVDLYATEDHSASVNGGGFRVKTLNTGVDAADGAETTKLDITDSVKILNPKAADTGALNVEGSIRLKNGTTPANVTDSSHFYAKDDGGVSHIYAVDEGGNEQKLSSHNSNNEWEYYSRNLNTGKVVRINMERMIRDIEILTGRKYIENE